MPRTVCSARSLCPHISHPVAAGRVHTSRPQRSSTSSGGSSRRSGTSRSWICPPWSSRTSLSDLLFSSLVSYIIYGPSRTGRGPPPSSRVLPIDLGEYRLFWTCVLKRAGDFTGFAHAVLGQPAETARRPALTLPTTGESQETLRTAGIKTEPTEPGKRGGLARPNSLLANGTSIRALFPVLQSILQILVGPTCAVMILLPPPGAGLRYPSDYVSPAMPRDGLLSDLVVTGRI